MHKPDFKRMQCPIAGSDAFRTWKQFKTWRTNCKLCTRFESAIPISFRTYLSLFLSLSHSLSLSLWSISLRGASARAVQVLFWHIPHARNGHLRENTKINIVFSTWSKIRNILQWVRFRFSFWCLVTDAAAYFATFPVAFHVKRFAARPQNKYNCQIPFSLPHAQSVSIQFCSDWLGPLDGVGGSRVAKRLLCSVMHTQWGIDSNTGSPDCVIDFEKVHMYIRKYENRLIMLHYFFSWLYHCSFDAFFLPWSDWLLPYEGWVTKPGTSRKKVENEHFALLAFFCKLQHCIMFKVFLPEAT
jgi:hypothetical protein